MNQTWLPKLILVKRNFNHHDDPLITFCNTNDYSLFLHLSGGLNAVTQKEFTDNMEPIIKAHGIQYEIRVEEVTETK